MMTRRLTATLLALAASGLALADTITMKDGTTYEGEVLSEDAESYLVAIQVTATIKDERRLLKENVESVDRSSPDDEAFAHIKDLVPTPDRLTVKAYDKMINKQVKAFTEAFPATTHKKEVATILATLEEERELAASGALKLNGKWISASNREANAFEIDASIELAEMQEAVDAGDFKTALRQFEVLDRDFQASDSYVKAVELANMVLDTYRPQLAAAIKRAESLIPKRKAELELLPLAQKTAAYEEIARRDKAYEAIVEREKKERTKWLSTELYHKGPMEEIVRNIDNEKKRLAALKLDEIKKAGTTYREAYAAVATGDQEAAVPLIGELKGLRIPARYTEELETKLAAKIAEMEEPDPEPDETPVDPEPEPADGGEPESGDDPPAESGTDGDAGEETPDADTTGDDAPQVAPRDPVEIDDGSPMKTILFIVMAVVLVIALIAMFAGKKKR